MTRENKLALVVGFGLLLFVGILVSDHFSAAQRQETTKLSASDTGRDRAARPITIAAVTPPAASATTVQPEPMAAPAPVVQPTNGVTPISSQPEPVRQTLVMEPAAPVKPAATKTQESEPGVRMHPIAEGETLFSICKKEYNDGSLSLALAKYNKNVIPDPKKLRKGVTIRIPSAETLRGEGKSTRVEAAPRQPASNEVLALAAADVIAAETKTAPGGVVNVELAPGGKGASKSATKSTQSADASKSGAKTTAPSDASKGSTYTVRKGDTLYSIAQRELGSKGRWQEIAALNGGSDSLSPGTTIKLPARR